MTIKTTLNINLHKVLEFKNKNKDKNYYEIEEYDYYNKNYNDYKYSLGA